MASLIVFSNIYSISTSVFPISYYLPDFLIDSIARFFIALYFFVFLNSSVKYSDAQSVNNFTYLNTFSNTPNIEFTNFQIFNNYEPPGITRFDKNVTIPLDIANPTSKTFLAHSVLPLEHPNIKQPVIPRSSHLS